MSTDLRDQFLLREDVIYLNHGSFGACPAPVHRRYQALQCELESNPMAFLAEDREFPRRMREARQELARFLGAQRDDLVFVPNATYGLNVAARSVGLQRGDEVLVTDHGYGAIDRTWAFVCEKRGARLVRARIDLPVESAEQVVEDIWSQVTDRTQVICLDHITSPTALILPIRQIIPSVGIVEPMNHGTQRIAQFDRFAGVVQMACVLACDRAAERRILNREGRRIFDHYDKFVRVQVYRREGKINPLGKPDQVQ